MRRIVAEIARLGRACWVGVVQYRNVRFGLELGYILRRDHATAHQQPHCLFNRHWQFHDVLPGHKQDVSAERCGAGRDEDADHFLSDGLAERANPTAGHQAYGPDALLMALS